MQFDVHAGTHLDSVLSTPSGIMAAADLTPVFEGSAVRGEDSFGANDRPISQPQPEPEPEPEPEPAPEATAEAQLNEPDQLHAMARAATVIQSYWLGHSCRQARTMERLHREREERLRRSKANVGTG